jgi:hypothetical protein
MNILHDKWPCCRRAAEQRDELAAAAHSITSSARNKKDSGDGQAEHLSAWMIAPMMYMIQIDCDND